MQITQANAAVVAAIFAALSDPRFTMRTVKAIHNGNDTFSEQDVANAATEMGMHLRHRIRDNAPLVERPASVTPQHATEFGQKAVEVLSGVSTEPMELSFAIVEEATVDEEEPSDEDTNFS